MRAIVWMSQELARILRERLPDEPVIVHSARELVEAERDSETVTFVDHTTIGRLDGIEVPRVIVVSQESLQTAVGWLAQYPWVSHVINLPLLQHSIATEHLTNVIATLTLTDRPRLLDWIPPTVAGRCVRLARASKRVERLEKISEYLTSKGVGARTVQLIRDSAEELLTNAFYDAPVAAGARELPISRTQDVALDDEAACELVYGYREDLVVVRVRDPFGALTRARLLEVLTRCARSDMQVEVDESMGGAGLGLWKIFTSASFVAVAVIDGYRTEFLVGIAKRAPGPRPFGIHLFFAPGPVRHLDEETPLPATTITIAAD